MTLCQGECSTVLDRADDKHFRSSPFGAGMRWAAVAVTSGAGGLAVTGVTNATGSSGERDVFVPLTPCRLFDMRAGSTVGTRNTPIGPGETIVEQVSRNPVHHPRRTGRW